MAQFSRRTFVKASGAALALGSLGMPGLLRAGKHKGRVIVVGGGYGGAIAAKGNCALRTRCSGLQSQFCVPARRLTRLTGLSEI